MCFYDYLLVQAVCRAPLHFRHHSKHWAEQTGPPPRGAPIPESRGAQGGSFMVCCLANSKAEEGMKPWEEGLQPVRQPETLEEVATCLWREQG